MARYLYSELAQLIQARANCVKSNNPEWHLKHSEKILELVSEFMPSGSGFDNGTKIDVSASHAEKLIFTTAFHHMHDSGMYDGWTEHTVTVTPSFTGINIRISGRNRNDVKEWIDEQFRYALMRDDWNLETPLPE